MAHSAEAAVRLRRELGDDPGELIGRAERLRRERALRGSVRPATRTPTGRADDAGSDGAPPAP